MSNLKRRLFLSKLATRLGFGLGVSGLYSASVRAHHTDTHFEDETKHHLVYQCNKADPDYIEHVLFSCGEMLRKYGDNIELVITAFGPGLNLLGKHPNRLVKPIHQKRARSLAEYGVRFQACGNTMKSLNWVDSDLLEFAEVVPIGVDGIMQLQEEGFSYISI